MDSHSKGEISPDNGAGEYRLKSVRGSRLDNTASYDDSVVDCNPGALYLSHERRYVAAASWIQVQVSAKLQQGSSERQFRILQFLEDGEFPPLHNWKVVWGGIFDELKE